MYTHEYAQELQSPLLIVYCLCLLVQIDTMSFRLYGIPYQFTFLSDKKHTNIYLQESSLGWDVSLWVNNKIDSNYSHVWGQIDYFIYKIEWQINRLGEWDQTFAVKKKKHN